MKNHLAQRSTLATSVYVIIAFQNGEKFMMHVWKKNHFNICSPVKALISICPAAIQKAKLDCLGFWTGEVLLEQ